MLTSSWRNPSGFIILLVRLKLVMGIDAHIASVVVPTRLVATPSALEGFVWEGTDAHIVLG